MVGEEVSTAALGLNIAAIKGFSMNLIIFGGAFIFIVGFCITIGLWIRHLLRFGQFNVVIFFKDANGQWLQKADKAGVFINSKTKSRLLHLQKYKVVMNPDYIPFLMAGNKKVIYLKEIGIKTYVYVKHHFTDNDVVVTVGEEDLNAAIQDFEVATRVLKSGWEQYIPLIAVIIGMVVLLVIMIVYADKWQSVMIAGQNTAAEIAKYGASAAENLAAAKSGAVIVNP
jgi:hypothetical protein